MAAGLCVGVGGGTEGVWYPVLCVCVCVCATVMERMLGRRNWREGER